MLSTDPIDLKLDDDFLLVVPLSHVSGLEGVAQVIRLRLQLFRGEWFKNLLLGMPYIPNQVVTQTEALLGGKFRQARLITAVSDQILAAPAVLRVATISVVFDPLTRGADVAFQAVVKFDDTPLDLLTMTVRLAA